MCIMGRETGNQCGQMLVNGDSKQTTDMSFAILVTFRGCEIFPSKNF